MPRPSCGRSLARVLGEVASSSLGADLIGLADDDLPELRAAAARAMSNAQPGHALEVLAELSRDTVWFVRLRAVVAMGNLYDPKAVPHLLQRSDRFEPLGAHARRGRLGGF